MEIDKLADKLPVHIFNEQTKQFLRINIRKMATQWRVAYESTFGEDSVVVFDDKLSGAVKKMVKELKV